MKLFPTILLFAAVAVSCKQNDSDFDFVWPAEVRNEMNVTMAFQLDKSFETPEATLEICASNGYMVFLNDEMIAFGPARTAHGYIRKDEIALKGLDASSKLTVDVIGNNINSFCYPDEKPYFAAKVLCGGRVLARTEDFSCFRLDDRIQKVERFSYQRDFAEAYRMSADRSLFYNGDRSLFTQYHFSSVDKPQILPRYAEYPEYQRIPMEIAENGDVIRDESRPVWQNRFIDNISDKSSKGFVKSDLEVCISDELSKLCYRKSGEGVSSVGAGTYTVADAGRTVTGWFDLRVKVNEPSLFYVVFDEIDFHEAKAPEEGFNIDYRRNDCVGAVRYELQPGEYHLVNFEQFSARFLKFVCVKGSLDIIQSKLIAFENPAMFRLEFNCADDSLNTIVRASQNTLAQNGVDLFTDCPQRERAGWLCDAFFSSRAEFMMTGENVIDRCFLENYAIAPQLPQLPEGMVPMCYPGDHIAGEFIPNWSMWYVLQLYDYYKRTGDKSLVEMSRAKVEGLVKYFQRFESPEGLLEDLENWVFIEWSEANNFIKGINFPSNMMYATMLSCAGELYADESLISKSASLKKKIADLSFNGEFFEDNMLRENGELVRTGNTSETCQYYAFFCGVADKTTYPDLYNTMFSIFGQGRDASVVYPKVYKSNAFVGNYLRMEILRRDQRTAQMISECKQFFHYMAERTGTLWEHASPVCSLNHGFASYAANFIIESVTGISDYDASSNTLYLTEPGLKMDCQAVIPFKGDKIVVDFNGDVRNIVFPEGLNVVRK